MNKKLKAIIIIEFFIVLGLIFHVVRTPHLWVVLGLAILFTVLATRSRARVLRMLSLIFWAITTMILFTVGWFWLAIVFPAIMCIIFWKNNPREGQTIFGYDIFNGASAAENDSLEAQGRANGNDVIDLEDYNFKASGNRLSIKKNAGNTKIIVPHDVAIKLDATTQTGLIKIFDETPQINAGNLHYFSEGFDHTSKKITLFIRVETGNIEVVRG